MNRLAQERSAYLQHAAHQKIDWYPWSDEAFRRAEEEDKPVFLSTGAVWCHWCHVMARECFENDEITGLLNEHFISIKLDRDERPDIDRRYQQAVAAMGSGGGWPLSVFLTFDRKPFFGGTYFPPEDSHGRPGFGKVLKEVSRFYHQNRDKVKEYSAELQTHLRAAPLTPGALSASLPDEACQEVLGEFDAENGGFGTRPKFPMPGAVELLINRYFFTRQEAYGHAVRRTLESMAKGGCYDQIGGGFHRYSTDEAWIVPHFEKMADDNAWLLRNYLDAYALFGEPFFRETAEGILRYVSTVLSDPEGGFYASQDADVTPEDEGGYFTWTEEQMRKVLDGDEFRVLSLHLFHERGAMHHDPAKRVLFVAAEPGEISRQTGMDPEKVSLVIGRGKEKLLKARDNRQPPFIDKTLFVSLNGMMITSFLRAYRVLGDPVLRDSGMRSLTRILERYAPGTELYHTDGVRALLDDYIFLIESLISAYEVTGDASWLGRAELFMDRCIEKFWDGTEGGFFDTDEEVLGTRLKGVDDVPHPSANSAGIMQLHRLWAITGREAYHTHAEQALKIFLSRARDMGIHAGYYYCSLDAYYSLMKIGLNVAPGGLLASTALSAFRPYASLSYGEDDGTVTPCLASGICLEPVTDCGALRDFLTQQRKGGDPG